MRDEPKRGGKRGRIVAAATAAVAIAFAAAPAPGLAQTAADLDLGVQSAQAIQPEQDPAAEPGSVRIQGRDTFDDLGPDLGPATPLLDFREEMRSFVSRIATFARRSRPDFSVMVEDALELLTKRDDIDETQTSPARAFMRSIDGVIVSNLFSGNPDLDDDENAEIRNARLDALDLAVENGLAVFVLDQASERAKIDEGYRQARQRGFVYHAREQGSFETTDLPSYPPRAFDENGNSVVSLRDIGNFAVVGNSAAYGRQDEFALRMHQTNYDVIIVDVFHGRQPLTKQAVETLKYKATGARRLVFARIDIGTAASYRYYWQPNWRAGSPRWIGSSERGEPDNYFVEFWRPEWQRIIFGDTASYVYGVVDQGYDGVILGGADVFEIYEGGEAAEARTR